MSKKKVIAVFDIGKTNKKILLFNENLKIEFQSEEKFPTTVDDDGFECDDIALIEKWVVSTIEGYVKGSEYEIIAVNFSTYGASLAFLDNNGERLTPIYNYLKEVPVEIQTNLFDKFDGVEEFCRKTASPALGLLLNSGIQMLWLKKEKPEVFAKVKDILHFPQYLSYLFTNNVVSDATSVGCHTFLWDYDNGKYHDWLNDANIALPEPKPNNYTTDVSIAGDVIKVGTGIHDSSSSLAPYILGSKDNFMLVSTGTWCINMNPFNHTPLTAQQLQSDCLSFLSIDKNPVKSSRLFMGHIHDVNTERLTEYFKVEKDRFKKIGANEELMKTYLSNRSEMLFFKDQLPDNYIDNSVDLSQFANFDEAYQRLMFDLTLLNKQAMDLVFDAKDGVENIYISGGFARNVFFVRLMANFYPDKKIYTSEVDNSSALGAALVLWNAFADEKNPNIDLGLVEWKAFEE